MKILFCFIGAYVGYIIGDWSNAEETGVGLGFFIGWIAGALIQQKKMLKKLEAQLNLIQSNLIDSRVDVDISTAGIPSHEELRSAKKMLKLPISNRQMYIVMMKS